MVKWTCIETEILENNKIRRKKEIVLAAISPSCDSFICSSETNSIEHLIGNIYNSQEEVTEFARQHNLCDPKNDHIFAIVIKVFKFLSNKLKLDVETQERI